MQCCASVKGFSYLLLLLIALLAVSLACTSTEESGGPFLTSEQLEAEAQSIDESLICPSCPGKTIGQAQVTQAAQMRLLVRQKLAEGWSRQQILDYFAERYEGVLAEPPKQGFTLLAWLLPLAGVLGGATVVFFVVRAMSGRPQQQAPDPELDDYLERVDRDLGRSSMQSGGTPGTRSADSGDV